MNWTKESRELMNKLEFKIPAGYSMSEPQI